MAGKELIRKMFKPTTGTEMGEFAPEANIMVYRDLKKLNVLPPLPLILLYETQPNMGHWVLVIETPEGIEHFDSYGIKPDGEISFVPLMFRAQSGQASPHLVRLLLNTGRPINFSDYQLQGKDEIATCGRWCVIRLMFADMPSDDFIKMIAGASQKYGVPTDLLAVALTEPELVKKMAANV